jgi:hypothetical protein
MADADEQVSVYTDTSHSTHLDEVKQYLLWLYKGADSYDSPLRLTNGFYVKMLEFNLWVHHGDSMQVGKRNPLGTVTFTGIDFAANRQTRVVALL